jgi:phage major head subunit gpT-like protein
MAGIIGSAITRASNLILFESLDLYKEQPWRKLATVAPSTAASEKYEWLGDLPGMKEWLSARQVEGIAKYDYTIVNKPWEATIGFKKHELNDNSGILRPRIAGLAQSVQMHPNKLVFDLLKAGHTAGSLCYDGQLFFDTDHPNFTALGVPSTDGINYLAGNGVDTVAHIATDFFLALTAMTNTNRRKDGSPVLPSIGKPNVYHAVHDTAMFQAAFNTPFLAAGASNSLFNLATPVPCPWLTTDSSWFLVAEGMPVQPIIFQDREPVTPAWDETQAFSTGKVFYGVEARYNVGYGLWQGALMVYNA